MTIDVAGIPFEGPHFATATLRQDQGIYAILDYPPGGKQPEVLDIGESAGLRDRIGSHDRADQWRRTATGRIGCAIFYTSGWAPERRRSLESQLRQYFTPPCGDR